MKGGNVIIVGDEGTVLKNQSATGTRDILNAQNISYYPNPTTGEVYIELDNERNNIGVKIMDVLGRMVAEEYIGTAKQFHISLDGTDGIYFMEVKTMNNTPILLKVIKD